MRAGLDTIPSKDIDRFGLTKRPNYAMGGAWGVDLAYYYRDVLEGSSKKADGFGESLPVWRCGE